MDKSYYNENRYYDADVTQNDIKLEIDTSSPVYANYEQDYVEKLESIKLLEDYIAKDSVVKAIVDKIPTTDIKKKVNLTIEETNKFYAFCKLRLEDKFTNIQIFDIATTYLSIEGKDFYSKLSIKFKELLLEELEDGGHYKSKALF